MKKYFKILFALSVIFVIGKSFFNMSHAQAEDKISENTDNTFEMYEAKKMEEDNNVITPFGTFWGSDGTATFNYMPTARSFSWTLNIPAASGAFLSYVSPQAYDNGIPFMY